jgi:hypothetical protein
MKGKRGRAKNNSASYPPVKMDLLKEKRTEKRKRSVFCT